MSNEHREQAREIVERFFPPDANPEAQWKTSLINAIASRDTEMRDLLGGFIHAGVEFDDERMSYVVMQVDRRDLEKARELYAKLQPGEKKLMGR